MLSLSLLETDNNNVYTLSTPCCLQMILSFVVRRRLWRRLTSIPLSITSVLPLVRLPISVSLLSFLASMSINPTKQAVKSIFPVLDLNPNTIHLGHPLVFSHRDRSKAYDFILDKFKAKLTTVKANKLNHAGRLTYIKSDLASIPVYYMSTVIFSETFVEKNQFHH